MSVVTEPLDSDVVVDDLKSLERLLALFAEGMPQDVIDDLERARWFVMASLARRTGA